MQLNEPILGELKAESSSTRKMLERVPEASFSWKPHEKSMTLLKLAGHVADIPSYLDFIVNEKEVDLAARNFTPKTFSSTQELVQDFDEKLARATEALRSVTDEALMEKWKLRVGEHVVFDLPRIQAIRSMVFSHFIHHRGQLSVYLRLLDIPVPGMYGPSADER